ncbi:glycosyltransferase [Crinalium epipsammum]|uniref:glycosyltransferase n=1 Tax=Crinalium epipsammum TaxID=241425 RepID=UPI0002FD238E|nr:glycosyltransferase [Crinalium epipsammum]
MTSDFPLVSVIIPVYNRDRYLAEAIEEAAKKALDTSLILETHEYFKSCERRNISPETIRFKVIEKIQEHRLTLIKLIQSIYDQEELTKIFPWSGIISSLISFISFKHHSKQLNRLNWQR